MANTKKSEKEILKELYTSEKLEEIAAKVKDDIELVREGNTFYLVMNKPMFNAIDNDYTMKMSKLLDEVENTDTKGEPACLITFSTTYKCFSTGFSIRYMASSFVDEITTVANFQYYVLSKILKLSIPTMAVIRGKAYATGLIFALCHDVRIMLDNPKGRIYISEMSVGRILPPVYDMIVKATLPIQTARELYYSIEMNGKEAHQKGVITTLCKSGKEIDAAMAQFVKIYGPKAWNREVLGEIKKRMFKDVLAVGVSVSQGPMDIYFNANQPIKVATDKPLKKKKTAVKSSEELPAGKL